MDKYKGEKYEEKINDIEKIVIQIYFTEKSNFLLREGQILL